MPETLSRAAMLKSVGYTEQSDLSALARILNEPGVRELLGEVEVGRVKEFPIESQWLFRDLMNAYNRKEVSPKTALAWLQERRAVGPALDVDFTTDDPPRGTDHPLALPSASQGTQNALGSARVPGQMIVTLSQGIVAAMVEQKILPERVPVEDSVIDKDEAARILGLDNPDTVGRHVQPIRPRSGKYSRLMVLQTLETWRDQAREKRERMLQEKANRKK